MKKSWIKIVINVIVLTIFLSMFSFASMAKVSTESGNTWYGDELAVDVIAGTDAYTYMSLFRRPAHGYEFAGHFLGYKDAAGLDVNTGSAQTFVVIDTVAHNGTTWTPSGLYDPMASNYEVTYCCDAITTIVDGVYYKRLNLEDSEYYTKDQAAKIRSIVTNSYPYVSLEAMKADLAANGFPYANELTRGDIISAVQTAVWLCSNYNDVTREDLRYLKSYKVTDNLQWGYPLHDTSSESGLEISGKRKFGYYPDTVGVRHDALVDYLLAQTATFAEKAEIVITKIELSGKPIALENGMFTVKLIIELNNSGSGYDDNIFITLTAGGDVMNIPVELGKEKYEVILTADRNETIKAVVSGTQVLPRGVYFYAPKAADVNADGIATAREVSQNLVGVAMGATPVYAEAELTLSEMNDPEKVDVFGHKTWNDENNKDGIRPGFINVNLHANGTIIASKTVTEFDGWTWHFTNLDKYTADGRPIVYSVSEDYVEGYISSVYGYNITNTYIPQRTHVITQKVWNDNNDQDGLRPDSITVRLLANGFTVDSAVLSEANGWIHIFQNLDKYENGIEIDYSVYEEPVYGYTSSVMPSMYSGYVITNTHTPETVSVNGSKTWIDNNNINNTRPQTITVNLYANGEYVTSKTVSEASAWTYSFDNLARYKNGEEIVYSITEEPVYGYTTEIIGHDIINVLDIPEEPYEEIDDEDVPLTPPPTEEEIIEMIEEMLEEILDEEVPLADNPETSDDPEEEHSSITLTLISVFAVFSSYVALTSAKALFGRK